MSVEPIAQNDLAPRTSILVVDDNAQLRAVMKRILGRQGYETAEARSGAEALRQVDARSFDLVLLDLVMPDMDGRSVAAAIATRRPSARIVFVSGGDPEVGAPMDGALLCKPFTPESLLEAVQRATAVPRERPPP